HRPAPSQRKPAPQAVAGTRWPLVQTCGWPETELRSPSTQGGQEARVAASHSAAEAQVLVVSSPPTQVRSTLLLVPLQRAPGTRVLPSGLQTCSESPLRAGS